MITALRLVAVYFTATRWQRACSVAGIGLLACSALLGIGTHAGGGVGALGLLFVVLASLLMPVTVGRLAQGRQLALFQQGRATLLFSALLTVTIPALLAAVIVAFPLLGILSAVPVGRPPDPELAARIVAGNRWVAAITFTGVATVCGWLYLAAWFLTGVRGLRGALCTLLLLMALLLAPVRDVARDGASLPYNIVVLALQWTLFSGLFLAWPRLRAALANQRAHAVRGPSPLARGNANALDMVLGTDRPWRAALVQVVPVLAAVQLAAGSGAAWLYFLALFCTVTAASTGLAASRARSLWLLAGLSREQLFARVSLRFLRSNGIAAAVMAVAAVAWGLIAGVDPGELQLAPLLVFTGVGVSSCLGLCVTRGLGLTETALGIAIAGLLVLCAVLAATRPLLSAALLLALAATGPALFALARRRWSRLDWTQCRPARRLRPLG